MASEMWPPAEVVTSQREKTISALLDFAYPTSAASVYAESMSGLK
jgi:hypothetical protein